MSNYEFTYGGSVSSLDPNYGDFVGYRIPAGELGIPTGIQTANQLMDVANSLNQGQKVVELQAINPEIFDQIPKQHFKEIERMQKLAGAETTVHAPIIEPSGFAKEGWSETNRETVERQLIGIMDKSHELSPQGNMPVTIHASASLPGADFVPIDQVKDLTPEEKEKYGKLGRVPIRRIAIDQESKKLIPLERETKYYPESGKEAEVFTPDRQLTSANNSDWINKVTNLAFYKKEADEILEPTVAEYLKLSAGNLQGMDEGERNDKVKNLLEKNHRAELFLENVETSFRALFDKAYKFGDEKSKEVLDEISENWKTKTKEMNQEAVEKRDQFLIPIRKSELIDETLYKLKAIGGQNPKTGEIISAPQLYKPIEEFAVEQSSKTIGNVAFDAYDKHGTKAPIVSVENLFPGMAFSRSDELKELVEASRQQFVNRAVAEGKSKSQAQDAAKKLIGVTWDVGHLNMMRKEGFESKDIEAATKEIAPFVKHVHLTDNFGFSDSHLPPGMGNVPTKEILEDLEKGGFKGKKIIEAGAFVQHFKTSPHPSVLQAFGSPMGGQAPYWNQAQGITGGYFSGYGPFLPEQHFAMYGAGFSGLPQELGGQVAGRQSRMGGTPMA